MNLPSGRCETNVRNSFQVRNTADAGRKDAGIPGISGKPRLDSGSRTTSRRSDVCRKDHKCPREVGNECSAALNRRKMLKNEQVEAFTEEGYRYFEVP